MLGNKKTVNPEAQRQDRSRKPKSRYGRGIGSRNRVWSCVAKLHRQAARNDNPIPVPTWFLAPISSAGIFKHSMGASGTELE